MILKVGNGKDWHFVDGIKTLTYANDTGGITPLSRNLSIPPLDTGDENSNIGIIKKTITIDFGNANIAIYNVSATYIYLLSDIGKTIEKITN